ncbi:MAG TPA: sialidase family protein, partial [Vicinamibacteria bacterium]|nr:sialidase family protein [Vicinamibacteria bacterium]
RNPVACGDYVNDHQTFFSGPPPAGLTTSGYPNVLYYCFNRVADSSCGRSLDGGKTWLPTLNPAYLGVDGGVCGGLHGHGVTDSAGRVFLPKGHCGKPYVSVSSDGGDTWTAVKVSDHVGTAGTHTSVAVDAADNVYMLWWDGARRLPYLSVSRDHGMTWGTPLMIAPPEVNEVNFPTMAAGDAGRIVVSFPGTTSTGVGDLNRPWNYYVTISTNALDERPTFTYALANPVSDPIHRGNCGPGRCAGMFDFLDVIVSPASGAAWATATDTCTGACVSGGGAANAADGLSVVQVGGPTLREKQR